jgi:hypothetical protein
VIRHLSRGRITIPAALIVFSGLAVLCRLPVWMHPTVQYSGSADAEQMMWFLSWPAFALTHHLNPLLSTYVNYPTGFNLLWNTSMPVMGILLWPVTAVWGAVVTYNVITTAAMALSAFFAFLAIRRYVHYDLFSAAGGLLYGFSPAMIAQQPAHAQVAFSAVTIPLALLLFDELAVRQRMRWWLLGVLIAGLGVFQFFVFEEFFATEIIVGLILAVVLAISHRRQIAQRLRYAERALMVGAGLAAAALAYPLLFVQLTGPDRVDKLFHDPDTYSTSLLNFVLPNGNEVLAPASLVRITTHFSGNPSEADGYVGLPLLVIGAVVLVRYWKVPFVRATGITSIVVGFLSLGSHLHISARNTGIPLLWPFSQSPVLGNILPSRLMYFAFLGVAVLLAFALERLWSWRRNILLPLGLAVIALAPLIPPLPIFSQPLTVASYFSTRSVSEIPAGAVVYTMPFPGTFVMDPMNWQRVTGMRFKLLGGYILGPTAPHQDALQSVANAFGSSTSTPAISDSERTAFTEQLHENDVSVVIVDQMPNQAAAAAFCTSVLGMPPQVRDGLDIWILNGGRSS